MQVLRANNKKQHTLSGKTYAVKPGKVAHSPPIEMCRCQVTPNNSVPQAGGGIAFSRLAERKAAALRERGQSKASGPAKATEDGKVAATEESVPDSFVKALTLSS